MKVIIVGAGISGLTLAIACQRAGIEVKIYEQAEEISSIGGGILLWPHALRYLTDLNISACLRDSWQTVKALDLVGHRENIIVHESHDEIYSLIDGEILPINRSQLQCLLLNLLPNDCVELNKKCVDIHESDKSVSIEFADGETDTADLIVGADGIHSAVRKHIFPKQQPRYSGFCWWGGIVDAKYVPDLPLENVHFVMGVKKLCSIWPTAGKKFMWYLPVKMSRDTFDRRGDGSAQAQEIVAGWNTQAEKLVTAPQAAQRFHVPIYDLMPQAQKTSRRCVLIGDAACTFGPLLGQGANKAIEDAYVLAKLIEQERDLSITLSRYQTLRHERHARFFELEHAAQDSLIQENQDSLSFFEEQIVNISLADMYEEIIPLVNKAACHQLMDEARQPIQDVSAA